MFYGLNNIIKRILPKRLFYRSLIIVATPMILLQIIITIVFFDSLWIKANKGMTRSLVGEVKTLFDVYKNEQDHKQMIIDSSATDIVYTAAVSGVPASFLRPSLESMGITEEMWGRKAKMDFGKELDAAQAEAKAWSTIWSAGQGVTNISDDLPVQELVDRITNEFKESIKEQSKLLDKY